MEEKERDFQKRLVLESAKKDITNYINGKKRLKEYDVFTKGLENDILFKMETHNFTELGGLELKETPMHKSINVKEFKSLFLDEDLTNNIMVKIDLESTKEHLRVNLGFAESKVDGIIDMLERLVNSYKRELVIVDENTSDK